MRVPRKKNKTRSPSQLLRLSAKHTQSLIDAARTAKPVAGYTHDFYRYPARFSPLFARACIQAFTDPGDLILDPFMGGGTTLVEARALGRVTVGCDISSLAAFVSNVKTRTWSASDVRALSTWAEGLPARITLNKQVRRPTDWIEDGYQRNLQYQDVWPIRKSIELAIADIESKINPGNLQDFARCAVLRTAQWALDGRLEIPTPAKFRHALTQGVERMLGGAAEFSRVVTTADRQYVGKRKAPRKNVCLQQSAISIDNFIDRQGYDAPKLILTSPPYPGVHVLYHRWQVLGGRETPAPFWIADKLDGSGESYYTFGHRQRANLTTYFETATDAFRSLAKVADNNTIVVQMLAFSEPEWQLPRYLDAMETAGFEECRLNLISDAIDGRLWRAVPNRKWHAAQKGQTHSSREVILFHRIAR
jgi:DNA modification methylase